MVLPNTAVLYASTKWPQAFHEARTGGFALRLGEQQIGISRRRAGDDTARSSGVLRCGPKV